MGDREGHSHHVAVALVLRTLEHVLLDLLQEGGHLGLNVPQGQRHLVVLPPDVPPAPQRLVLLQVLPTPGHTVGRWLWLCPDLNNLACKSAIFQRQEGQ